MKREVAGKVVLITGAAGGLGAALCQRYAAAGAHIAAMDRDTTRLDVLVADLLGKGANALALPGDITDPAACQAAVESILANFGALDGLINNAGISHRSLLADTEPDVIRRVMEVNFFGATNLTQAALPHIAARQGFIVAISSVAGFAPLTGRTGYAASKHALHGFFDSLRSEVEGAGVGVTLVCPSFIRTGIGAAATDGSGAPASSPRITSGGESTPEEIAAKIFDAVRAGRQLLLPDATSRKAWWLSRLAPGLYARIMKQRVGEEFAGLV
ncbi:MAG: SDR family oxidoreductase [Burkholderiaceae bacterium]|nr:SDR family oxidoreductase [Sulfuritalea sp.]MCF8175356.1 SDR family oxidoreductase [Burkholderiaceae bacterium]